MPVPNRACAALFGSNVAGANMLRRLLVNPAAVQAIVNWPEVAWAEPARLRRHLDRAPLDAGYAPWSPSPRPPWPTCTARPSRRVAGGLSVGSGRRGGGSHHGDGRPFDPVVKVTLDELRVSLFYPLDARRGTLLPHMPG